MCRFLNEESSAQASLNCSRRFFLVNMSSWQLIVGACLGAAATYLLLNGREKHAESSDLQVHEDLTGLIGNTPMIKIQSLSKATGCTILGKAEFLSIGGSSKDRVALSIVKEAERSGSIKPHTGCVL